MFKKTTGAEFMRYGNITNEYKDDPSLIYKEYTIENDVISELYRYDAPVYIELISGLGIIKVCKDLNTEEVESFAIHKTFSVHANEWFAIVPMDDYEITFRIYQHPDTARTTKILHREIPYKHIVRSIYINEIIADYYVIKRPNYHFKGERHHYYELTYVDQGSLSTNVDGVDYQIKQSQCMLYGPNQFHDQRVSSEESCSYLTVIFSCDGLNDERALNRVFNCSRSMVKNMEDFVKYSDTATYLRADSMINSLTALLIAITRMNEEEFAPKPVTPARQTYENRLINEIIEYINKHISEPLPIDQVCDRFAMSRSALQKLFKNNLDISPKQYINNAKLSKSRTLIRDGEYSMAEIANMLGFTSLNYFSTKFISYYGISPNEYARQIYPSDNDERR